MALDGRGGVWVASGGGIVQEEGAATAGSLNVVRNWFEKLKRLVPNIWMAEWKP